MGFIHEAQIGESLQVGPYQFTLQDTSPGPPEAVTLRCDPPDAHVFDVVLDRAQWWVPEERETRPNSPQYRRDQNLIHLAIKRQGNVGHESAELVIEAPSEVPIEVDDAA